MANVECVVLISGIICVIYLKASNVMNTVAAIIDDRCKELSVVG